LANQSTAIGVEATPLVTPRRRTARLVFEAMRPLQWVKNGFVLGGLVFSGEALEAGSQLRAWTVFAAFCLASGAAYLVNDVIDAEGDRHNPRTAGRPIARGDLAERTALLVAMAAAAVALAATALVNWETLLTMCGFLALQGAYSYRLKHLLLIDVMAISAGFVLRAYAGLVSIDVEISSWLLLCTGLVALFLGLAKRRAEVVAVGGAAHPQRPVLEGYSIQLVDELTAVVTSSTVVAYSLYAVLGAKTDAMLLTVPFVLYGIFRVLYLIHHQPTLPEDPSIVVWQDRPLLVCIAAWGLTAGIIAVASA
jgi:4-hydroxybenzoate polyprenyltransferase